MQNVTYDRMSLIFSRCFLRIFLKDVMATGPDFLDSEFDAVTLHKADFLEPKIEYFTLSRIIIY